MKSLAYKKCHCYKRQTKGQKILFIEEGKNRRIIFGAAIEIPFEQPFLKILACFPQTKDFYCVLDQKYNGKIYKFDIEKEKDEVMGTFFMRRIFYDHLNKKDSKLILLIKSFLF